VGKPAKKRPIGTPKIALEANIKVGLTGFEGVNSIYQANDRDKDWTVFNIVLNIRFP
jgi:hypothetical protein